MYVVWHFAMCQKKPVHVSHLNFVSLLGKGLLHGPVEVTPGVDDEEVLDHLGGGGGGLVVRLHRKEDWAQLKRHGATVSGDK